MTHGSREAFRSLALRHLSPEDAEKWLGLLRPGTRLEVATDTDGAVGRLGGVPALPAGAEWPVWEGYGPLSFVASIDCARLSAAALDIDLPEAGTLLFFYFDGQLDDGEALVLAEDRQSWAGARVLYVAAEEQVADRGTPAGLKPYPVVPLTARVEMTATEPWHPSVRAAFAPGAPLGNRYDHPVCSQEFIDGLWEFDGEVGHQIGGHAHSVQNPVEIEIAEAVLDGEVPWDDPRLSEEAGNWLLLAQFDSEDAADMMWGDAGALYWLIRPEDLAERRFERAMFTWQCG
ncbi:MULTISPECIES: YwqG family protein [unclassified Streptomyces]|uniref:YwqG family protein n=1 Tax=unclassified Streptomyces TaxID=2593676 RepID=UPI002ED30F91|nr:YwqG family protein [Streptomyces sp. NBC_00891]WSY05973.1 YwqG family protein [Streptomyces sp. NBC_00890]WSZ07597.1 YwqG family protein [Streptomyces sp. NBC_00869]WSZ24904.1 YwqG family protein [Streptomyces sp. NBC_00870]